MDRIRILLLEDDPDTSRITRRLLSEHHDVATAGSLAEAKRLCQQREFDLLICDLELPDGDGTDLLRYARTFCPVAGIVLSGHSDPERIALARQAGFAEYLLKPVTIDELEAAITRAMRPPSAGPGDVKPAGGPH